MLSLTKTCKWYNWLIPSLHLAVLGCSLQFFFLISWFKSVKKIIFPGKCHLNARCSFITELLVRVPFFARGRFVILPLIFLLSRIFTRLEYQLISGAYAVILYSETVTEILLFLGQTFAKILTYYPDSCNKCSDKANELYLEVFISDYD